MSFNDLRRKTPLLRNNPTDGRDPRHELLSTRMEAALGPVACTIVSVEELLRGWLALIHRLRDIRRQPPAYFRLGQLFNVLSDWEIVPFDDRAADMCAQVSPARDPHRYHGSQDRVDRPGP